MRFVAEDQHLTQNTLTASNEETDQKKKEKKKKFKPRLTFPPAQVPGILLTLFKL